ncbi:hypothetical protein ACHQM5_016148 [Ranunculus cassubicifolius]
MLGLGFEEHLQHKTKNPLSKSANFRDDSPDSVIFTQDSNFSLFSSASASVDRCSFASDIHDHDSLVSELSKHLAGSEYSSGADLETNYIRSSVQKSTHGTKGSEKAKGVIRIDWEEEEDEDRETEDDNQILDSARNSFSRALRECQILRFKAEAQTTLKKPDRRRPASLDLNNPKTNVIAIGSSPRFGGMKKSTVSSRNAGAFPSPGTPNYWQGGSGVQKGWSSERVPLPQNGTRRNVGAALLPFNSGRTLPSKWEDAEKWIFSPVSGDGINRALVPLPQKRPKSKSGPLGPPGVAYYSMYSPSIPMFERGNGGNFMSGSPFSAGVFGADRLPSQGQNSVGCGDGGSYSAQTESCMTRSASVHGWSSERISQTLPESQDEKIDGIKEDSTLVSRVASRRDMATQMSPDGSRHSSPQDRLSFSSSPPSFLPIVEMDSRRSSKSDVRDVQIDERVTVTRWSRKHGARGPERISTILDHKKKSMDTRASAWDVSEATKCMEKSKREEARITAWENLQKAKAEAAIRKLEMKLEKKRSSSMDKIMNKLRLAQKKAQDMRSSESDSKSHHVARTSSRIISFRKHTQISSLSGCFTCHAF